MLWNAQGLDLDKHISESEVLGSARRHTAAE